MGPKPRSRGREKLERGDGVDQAGLGVGTWA